ncbi:MAG: hypothetical protein ACFFCH_06805 [Promethearchaeota archaeon]
MSRRYRAKRKLLETLLMSVILACVVTILWMMGMVGWMSWHVILSLFSSPILLSR